MSSFSVDVAALLEMAGRLRGLEREFDELGGALEASEAAVGSPEVADRLGEFASNWSDKRQEIAELLQSVAGYATMAGEGYAEVEAQLCREIGG